MGDNGLVANHYALLVEDVAATVGHFEERLGVAFKSPARIPFDVAGHGERYSEVALACYSVDGSVELVEAHDSGPFAPPVGLHHFGGPVADLEAAVAAQRGAGNEVEWELSYEGELIAVFFTGGGALPGRLELVSASAPPLLEMYAESTEGEAA